VTEHTDQNWSDMPRRPVVMICDADHATGRVVGTDRTPQCQRPVDSSKHPHTTGRVRSIMTGRTTTSERSFTFTIPLAPDWMHRSHDRLDAPVRSPSVLTAAAIDRTRPVKPRPRLIQRPVNPVTSVRLHFYPRWLRENLRLRPSGKICISLPRKAPNPAL
jgi:hypothetical protein